MTRTTNGTYDPDRTILRLSGSDVTKFLQDLVTNNLEGLSEGLVYTALLTPQGKYLFDFFLARDGEDILLDIQTDRAGALAQRLTMYRLRADVQITETELCVNRGLSNPPIAAQTDPRHPALGWRWYSNTKGSDQAPDWTALRVVHCIPKTGIELIPDTTYILEAGFENLRGVDHRKGCYIGQEVTARMKHKTTLRKGFVTVNIDGSAPVGTEILADGKPAGTLFSQSNSQAIAYLRFDRETPSMTAADATITRP